MRRESRSRRGTRDPCSRRAPQRRRRSTTPSSGIQRQLSLPPHHCHSSSPCAASTTRPRRWGWSRSGCSRRDRRPRTGTRLGTTPSPGPRQRSGHRIIRPHRRSPHAKPRPLLQDRWRRPRARPHRRARTCPGLMWCPGSRRCPPGRPAAQGRLSRQCLSPPVWSSRLGWG